MQSPKPSGKEVFEQMTEAERQIRIELQMQLNRIKGRSFSKDQINEEVALRLAGKPGRLLLSEGMADNAPLVRESVASIQAREEILQRLTALEQQQQQLVSALTDLPQAIEKGLETLRAELQVDLQGQADSVVTQVNILLQRVVADVKAALPVTAAKSQEAKPAENTQGKAAS